MRVCVFVCKYECRHMDVSHRVKYLIVYGFGLLQYAFCIQSSNLIFSFAYFFFSLFCCMITLALAHKMKLSVVKLIKRRIACIQYSVHTKSRKTIK